MKIIKSPLYIGHKSADCRYKPGTLVVRDGYFWVPLIALHSGMRLGEILQLMKSDVKEENGIWYFDVNKGEGKSLKTASSKRRVPIHRSLIDLGLVYHVKQGQQSGRIFPEIKIGADGYHSHDFSNGGDALPDTLASNHPGLHSTVSDTIFLMLFAPLKRPSTSIRRLRVIPTAAFTASTVAEPCSVS